ncbi:MAG: hypothetical protein FWC06_06090 [Treponema sp.]|nr:hypothetical protein [Treponema sp.]
MKLSAPKQIVFLISVILIIVGVVIQLTGIIPFAVIGGLGFWLVFAGGALLSLGVLLKGF